MPLETGTYISDLVPSNPPATDQLAQADDHLRLIKNTLQNTFPNVDGEVTATQDDLNRLAALYARPVAVGSVQCFPKAPTSLGVGGVTTSGPFEYLEADGTTTWLIATYPALAAFYGTTFGGNGTTTFGVPNYKDTGRFLRSRTSSLAVGTYQTNALKSHTHTGGGSCTGTSDQANVGHTHTFSGTTSGISAQHLHTIPFSQATVQAGTGASGTTASPLNTSTESADHSHTYSGTTSDMSANHTHTFTGTISFTTNATGDTETRPEAGVVIMAIKT